jgi:hypothetical protein
MRFVHELQPILAPSEWNVFMLIWQETRRLKQKWVTLTQDQIGTQIGVRTRKTIGKHLKALRVARLISFKESAQEHGGYPLHQYALNWEGINKAIPLARDYTDFAFSLPGRWYSAAEFRLNYQGAHDVIVRNRNQTIWTCPQN